jgi:hypothetical protein
LRREPLPGVVALALPDPQMSPRSAVPIAFGIALAACYTANSDIATPMGAADATVPVGTNASAIGLPCEVADVLSASCSSCHGSPPSGGATNTMLSHDDLVAPAKSDPSKSVAALAVERMQDAQRPMPPTGPAPAAEVSALEAWISAGMPQGTCASASAPSGASVCTSNKTWTRGNRGSSSMHPGVACIACHTSGEGPLYTVAGTLYPTAHEPDDCNGTSSATVVVTDANGNTVQLTPNSAGNFASRASLATPLRVKVVSGSKVREMVSDAPSGDCNSCHTQDGTEQAPGRVMTP